MDVADAGVYRLGPRGLGEVFSAQNGVAKPDTRFASGETCGPCRSWAAARSAAHHYSLCADANLTRQVDEVYPWPWARRREARAWRLWRATPWDQSLPWCFLVCHVCSSLGLTGGSPLVGASVRHAFSLSRLGRCFAKADSGEGGRKAEYWNAAS